MLSKSRRDRTQRSQLRHVIVRSSTISASGSIAKAMHPVDLHENILLRRIGAHGGEIFARIGRIIRTAAECRRHHARVPMQSLRLPHVKQPVVIGILDIDARNHGRHCHACPARCSRHGGERRRVLRQRDSISWVVPACSHRAVERARIDIDAVHRQRRGEFGLAVCGDRGEFPRGEARRLIEAGDVLRKCRRVARKRKRTVINHNRAEWRDQRKTRYYNPVNHDQTGAVGQWTGSRRPGIRQLDCMRSIRLPNIAIVDRHVTEHVGSIHKGVGSRRRGCSARSRAGGHGSLRTSHHGPLNFVAIEVSDPGARRSRCFHCGPIQKRRDRLCIGGNTGHFDAPSSPAADARCAESYAGDGIVSRNKPIVKKRESIARPQCLTKKTESYGKDMALQDSLSVRSC